MSNELKGLLEVKPEELKPEVQEILPIPQLEDGIPLCQYCGKRAKKVGGQEIYPHLKALYDEEFWKCPDCDAYTGVYPNGNPKGTLANKELRSARRAAHEAFDPLWQDGLLGERDRKGAYVWLTIQLGMTEVAHIGFLSLEDCKKVVTISEREINKPKGSEESS